MEHPSSVPALEGLAIEAVEWLPSGADSGLVRVRGRWTESGRREPDLAGLVLRRGEETRRFESLPDARFGRDPAVWRATYLVPAALMDPGPDELWLSWESGARAGLPEPARGFEPPATPVVAPAPERGGEVIDRAVLAERRARRAEAAEQAQARRAAEALKAVEVLELRSAELERRLEALQTDAPPGSADAAARSSAEPAAGSTAPAEPATPAERAVPSLRALTAAPEAGPDAAAAALTEALAAVKRLRNELGEQRQRLRRSELMRAADAVALASLREEEGRARELQAELAVRERELADALAGAEASAAEAAAAREQASEQVASAAQRAAADAAAVRSRAAEELAAERAATTEARTDFDAERAAHATARDQLAGRERELTAIGTELAGVREELAAVRHDAEQRAAGLERRVTELDAALEAERHGHQIAAAERETARANLALAESARSAESVARAALDEELDRERAARVELIAELTAAQTTQSDLVLSREQARAELATERDRGASARAELNAANERASSELATARADLAAMNVRADSEVAAARAELEAANARAASTEAAARAELEAANARAASAEADVAAVRGRADSAEASVAELRPQLDAAREQLSAAEARIAQLESDLANASEVAGKEAGGLLARIAELERPADDDLDRRAREQAAAASAVARPAEDERREIGQSLDAAAAALRAAPADAPAAPARPARPQIVTAAKHPPRADVVGSSKRRYPWLRGALVKLAHDDPRAATRLVLGLVPVQRALVEPPLEYDLTIRGSGTYSISIDQERAVARSVGGPRPRDQAEFHASMDIVTLAEVLAGVEKRMGRWIGSVKLHGRRRRAEALRTALATADLDLAAAARAGADLDPDLVFRAFAYAIHPSWTKGHAFTVTQEIAGPRPMRWHVAARDGRPVTVERKAPKEPPDAVVSMTRDAYAHLLRGEQPPSGERPVVRGDRAAVAVLKSWTDRAQGG